MFKLGGAALGERSYSGAGGRGEGGENIQYSTEQWSMFKLGG